MMHRITLIILALVTVVVVAGVITAEHYTAQPQFCGSCHILINKPYDSWAESGHKAVECVDCHFVPGKESILAAKLRGVEHLFATLAAPVEANESQKLLKAGNFSCTTSECHLKGNSLSGKVDFAKDLPFTHKPHEDSIIEGKILKCGTCHSDVKSDEDYAVSQKICYLCNGLNHIIDVYFQTN